jgi:hypothetical protein
MRSLKHWGLFTALTAAVTLPVAPVSSASASAATMTPVGGQAVQTFLQSAEAGGLRPRFTATYLVEYAKAGGTVGHSTVVAAQNTSALRMYTQNPRFDFTRARAPDVEYEVFIAIPGAKEHLSNAAPGLYSCEHPASKPWSCVGPYQHLGMESSAGLIGPFPEYDLPDELSNALYYYLPSVVGAPLKSDRPTGMHAYSFHRFDLGMSLNCLAVGPNTFHIVGSACLSDNKLIVQYSFPSKASDGLYEVSDMIRYSTSVKTDAFTPPAKPQRNS